MRLTCAITLFIITQILATPCNNKKSNLKLVCYYSDVSEIDTCKCTHIILPSNTNISTIENVKEKFREGKTLITVNEFNQNLVDILNKKAIDGVDINLKKLSDKSDVGDFISTVKSKLNPDLLIIVSLPSKPEVLAKFYNLKDLSKHAEFFILQTAFLASSHNVTFHPSRLSGVWDTHNTDSVVDLVHGLGAPLSKIVVSAPVQAFQFTLQNVSHNIAGGPALDIKSITRNHFCKKVYSGKNWTLERDQDQAGPYVFLKKEWIAFEDVISIDIKAKYARVRGLAGLALKDLSQDDDKSCTLSLLEAAYNGLTKQARAPRSVVLQSLKQEILQPSSRPLDAVQISPYRISRVIDVEGNIHSIRKDTRTEFECSRQGYFMHPRSCGRFYRCVKFDQLSDDFNVFEFDCPDGLMFDSKTEVCVWPGSLPYTTPCSGSSEIAPVPKSRFICPSEEGYYADPENCRWFFACLDHGKSPLAAYEFRCPFGLMFDQNRLVCEWAWLVSSCVNEEAIKYTVNSHRSLLNSYDGLGNLNAVKLGGAGNAATINVFITANREDSSRNLYSDHNQNQFGQIVQPVIFGNNYEALSGNLNTGHNQGVVGQNYFDSKLLQTGNNFNYQNRSPFFKTLAIPNEQAKVVGGVSAVKYNSNNPQNFNPQLYSDSVSILNPSPVVAVAAAPVPFIGSNQNTNKFEVVANVPELQYKVIANQGSEYNVNNLGYSKGFSSVGSFSHNYNSNPLSRNPIYVTNQGKSQVALEETGNIQPNVFLNKLNSYSVHHPINYAVENVGHSSQFENLDNSGFRNIITSEHVAAVPNVLQKDRQVLTQVISQTGPLLQSYRSDQADSNGEQFIKSTLRQQPAVVSSFNYDSRLNNALTQKNENLKQQVLEAGQNVVNLGVESNDRENSRHEYLKQNSQQQVRLQETAKPAVGTSYFYQNVKPQVAQNVDYPLYDYKAESNAGRFELQLPQNVDYPLYGYRAEQLEPRQIQSFQSQLSSSLNTRANITLNQQPAVVSSYNYGTHLNEDITQQKEKVKQEVLQTQQNVKFGTEGNVRENIGLDYVKQNLNSAGYVSSEVKKPAIDGGYIYQHIQPQISQNYDYPLYDFRAESNAGQFEAQRIQSSQSLNKGKIIEGYEYQKPTVVLEEPVIIANPTPINPISNRRKSKIVSGYSFQNLNNQDDQQKLTLPVVQATYSQNIAYSTPAYETAQNTENGFTGYKYTTPNANARFIEIPSSTPTPTVEQQKNSFATSYINFGQKKQDKAQIVQTAEAFAPVTTEIRKLQPIIYSTEQTGENQNYNKEQTAQSLSHHFFSPQKVFDQPFDSLVISSTTPLPQVSESVSASNGGFQISSEANLRENNDVIVKFGTQNRQSIVQSPVTQTYFEDYYEGPAEDERIFYNIKKIENSERGYDYTKPQVVFEEKESKPLIIERFATTAPKQLTNFSFKNFVNEDANYNYNVEFTPQRIQPYAVPNINYQDEYNFGDYLDQKPKVELSQKPSQLVSGGQKIVENYNIKDKYCDESKQINLEFKNSQPSTSAPVYANPIIKILQTPSPIAKSTLNIIDDFTIRREGNRQQTVIKEAVQKSSFQGYDYPKPSVEFHEGTLEDYKDRQPVQEEPIVAKKAYLTYDNQNGASGQFTTEKSLYSPTIATVVANEPTGTFYYSDSRLQSTSSPLLKSVVVSNTANQIKTDDYLTEQISVPKKTYLPTTIVQEFDADLRSDIIVSKKPPTTKTYVRVNDAHPLLPAKLEAQCTCTSNPVTLRRKLPTTTPSLSLSEEDLYSVEREEPILTQRKTIVVENYSYRPTTEEANFSPVESISSTSAPTMVIKRRIRPVTSTAEPTSKIEKIRIIEEPKVQNLERGFNGYELGKNIESLPKSFECQRAGLFRHPEHCNKFYSCIWDCNKNKYKLHIFNCPVHLTFDFNMGACNWPSKGPACEGNTLLPNE